MSSYSYEEIEKEVAHLVGEFFTASDKIVLTSETALFRDLGADSLDATEIQIELEEHFCLELPDGFNYRTLKIGDIVDFIYNTLNAGSVDSESAVGHSERRLRVDKSRDIPSSIQSTRATRKPSKPDLL